MPTSSPAAVAADAATTTQVISAGTAAIEALPAKIETLPLLQHMAAVMPVADLVFGAGMLIVVMLVHAAGVRWVTNRVTRLLVPLLQLPSPWRADLLIARAVFSLLALHLAEMFLWSAALVYSGIVPDWRSAGFFAGNTYTTVGYGEFVLPYDWRMLAPIIAISGLFSFGWTGSVLVDIVMRCHQIKDAAAATGSASK